MDLQNLGLYFMLAVVVLYFGAALFQYLWNITIPDITRNRLTLLTFWQAFRIVLMLALASGGFIHWNLP